MGSSAGALFFGILIAALVGIVLLGGIRSIANVTSRLVPAMAGIYIVACLVVILVHVSALPAAIGTIIEGAFNPQGVAGGVIGALIIGFQRAAFSNEAGLGSAPIAHSAVKTKPPATVAGVAIGLILRTTRDKGESASPAERASHLMHPISAGVAVPLFALFAAGVGISGAALGEVFTRPEPLGVVLGLVIGKTFGIFAGTYLAVRFTRAKLNPDLAWADVLALAVLAGIGFTVALLVGELAFPTPAAIEHIKAAVLAGSLMAAALAGLLVKRRHGVYRRLHDEETRDDDHDGIPDIYQRADTTER
nr:Na+/H+ antiporter NhaA [Streptomyces sp. 135]